MWHGTRQWVLTVCLLAFLIPAQLAAQAVSGAITGAVTDPSGSGVPQAKVVVTNTATNVAINTTTSSMGYYTVPNLISGTYRVQANAQGFKTSDSPAVEVAIGATSRVDIRLEVGNLQETIAVTAEAPLLKDEKVSTGGTITTRQLLELPTIGRNPMALAKLMPGVIESPGGGSLDSLAANGQRTQLNYSLLDGVDNTEGVGGGATITVPVDAMQEFTVATSNYDVEFGQVAGAMTIMTTKSGTNSWHGSLFEYNRVNALQARNSFSEATGPGHNVWNQFGGTVGGPLKQNKFFVFGNIQGQRSRSGGNTLLTVPVKEFRGGNFSALAGQYTIYDPLTGGAAGVGRQPFAGNQIPADRLDPAVQKLINLLPEPTQPGYDNNYTVAAPSPSNAWLGTARADYNINDNSRAFARYTRSTDSSTSNLAGFQPGLYSYNGISATTNNSLIFDYTRVVTPTFVVEGRFGWNTHEWKQDPLDYGKNSSAELGFPGLNDACGACGGLAGFIIGGPISSFTVGNNDHAHQVDNYGGYNFVGTATWTKGSHTFKFGADYNDTWRDRRDTSSHGEYGCFNGGVCSGNGFAQSLTGSPDVPGSGLSIASFLLGRASAFGRVIYSTDLPPANQKRLAPYFQDTWRLTRKLTLVLGLRWDYIGYPTSSVRGGIASFDFRNADTIIAGYGGVSNTADVNNNYTDFGPRIGIAYRVTDNTVIRAGFGRTFALGFWGANFGAITNDWPNASRQSVTQPNPYDPALLVSVGPDKFISGFDILAAAGNPGRYPTPDYSTGFGTDKENKTHSIDQWNFSIQHQFGQNVSATVSYVGNAGRHVFWRRDWNATVPGPGPYADRKRFGSIGYLVTAYNQSNQSSTGYQALQTSVEKRYSQGLLMTFALTWARAYDFGVHNAMYPFNTNLDRAPTDDDRALVLSVGHVWDLPIGPNKKYLNVKGAAGKIIGGWQFSGITRWMSGRPFTPYVGDSSSLNSDCCTLRPDRIGTGKLDNPTRDRWFDASAFTRPGLYQYGNSGRNILRGPAFARMDLGLVKRIFFTESKNLELRWDVFNALNSTNLSMPNNAVDSSTAGQITGITGFMRFQQLGVDFKW